MNKDFEKRLEDLEKSSVDKFDTSLLSVTSGAVALGTGVLFSAGKVLPYQHISNTCPIKFALILWVSSLCIQILAHLLSARAMRSGLEKNRNYLIENLLACSNWLSYGVFLCGVVLFGMFISFNF